MKLLILCTGNSCRSQMAEGFLKSYDASLSVFSAGTKPAKAVNPNSIKVMAEVGIDISMNVPDNVTKYMDEGFDFVFTVCDSARELCPVFAGKVGKIIHHSFEDPWGTKGTEEEILKVYRRVRDEINEWFGGFYSETIVYISTKK